MYGGPSESTAEVGGHDDDIIQVKGAIFDSFAILEGDYLVVRPTDEPEKGAAVVAIQGDEDSPSTVICGAEELPSSAKLCGRMMRKV